MIRAVADTHAMIWYLFEDERLSRVAKEFMDDAAESGEQIGISAISMIEIVYLVEKAKINPETFERLRQSIEAGNAALVEIPVTGKIASRRGKSRGMRFLTCLTELSRPQHWNCQRQSSAVTEKSKPAV